MIACASPLLVGIVVLGIIAVAGVAGGFYALYQVFKGWP